MTTLPEGGKSDDEISLIDLFAVAWRRRAMIIAVSAVCAVIAVAVSIASLLLPPERSFLPNQYTPQAHMLINESSSSGGGLSSMLSSSGLGGLASLAGVSVPTSSTSGELAVYLIGANSLLDDVVDRFGLLERYKIVVPGKKPPESPRAKSRKALGKLLTAERDEKSGVFSVSFTDRDPEFAREVVNYCVGYLEGKFGELGLDKNALEKTNLEVNIRNTYAEIARLEEEGHLLERRVTGPAAIPSIMVEMSRIELEVEAQRRVYTELKTQYELLKVTMASEKPVFQILELAEAPDQKSGPSRGLLCVIVTLGGGFVGVFAAFVMNAVGNIRRDPEAMAKLRGER